MYTATKTSFPKVTLLNMVTEIETNMNSLRQIQKDCFTKIKSKFYRSIQLSKTESEYVWNLYYNFIIRDFKFDEQQVKKVTSFTTMNHIGMRMLHEMK